MPTNMIECDLQGL